MYKNEYSDFDIEEMNIKFKGEETVTSTGCIGTCEEALATKVLSKKCKGVVIKSVTKHSGGGELKITGRINYDVYCKMHGMNSNKLRDGVAAYGSGSHPNMLVTQIIRDEDGVPKLKAYPNCVVSSAPSRKVDPSTEEIAETEFTIALANDEYGECMYEEIITNEEESEALITSWMTNFTYDLVKKETA